MKPVALRISSKKKIVLVFMQSRTNRLPFAGALCVGAQRACNARIEIASSRRDARQTYLCRSCEAGMAMSFFAPEVAVRECATCETTFAVSARLTRQPESFIRHCASVNLQPQSHDSAFIRRNATDFCFASSFEKSTPGSSVARSAFFKKICPLSSKYSTFASTGSPNMAFTSNS